MMTRMTPLSWARGMTMFSRASDSGTSSMTEAGISISWSSTKCQAVLFGLGLHDVVGVGVAELDEGLLDRRRSAIRLASLS